jgi:hexokinase
MKLELGSGSMVINKKVEYRPIAEELTKGSSEVTVIILFHFFAR